MRYWMTVYYRQIEAMIKLSEWTSMLGIMKHLGYTESTLITQTALILNSNRKQQISIEKIGSIATLVNTDQLVVVVITLSVPRRQV